MKRRVFCFGFFSTKVLRVVYKGENAGFLMASCDINSNHLILT